MNLHELIKQQNNNTYAKNFGDKINALTFPTRKDETWKYSPLKSRLNLDIEQKQKTLTIAGENFKQLKESELNAAFTHLFEQRNADHYTSDICSYLGDHHYIVVNKNQKAIIELNFNSNTQNPNKTLGANNIFIHIESGAQVEIFEKYDFNDTNLINFANISINCEMNSHVEHVSLQKNAKATNNFINTISNLAKDSNYKHFNLSRSVNFSRTDLSINLDQENATASSFGLYHVDGSEHFDAFTRINHNCHHTFSEQFYKGMLDGNSRGVFTGRVFVAQDAQQIDSSQLNKNMLLSQKAQVHSQPQLEIFADDVKCAHGSTTGQIDEEQLFYLVSRGITRDRAIYLLLQGFSTEIIHKIKSDFMQAQALEMLTHE